MQIDKLSIRKLWIRPAFGVDIIRDLSIDITHGLRIAVIGSNGSGKTLLLQIMAGLRKPDKGNICYISNGKVVNVSDILSAIGFVTIDPKLPKFLSLSDCIHISAGLSYKWNSEIVGQLSDGFGLELSRMISTASKGELVCLQIIIALAASVDVLIMDEALSVMDPSKRWFFVEFYKKISKKITFIYSTNVWEQINGIASHILYVGRGECSHLISVSEMGGRWYRVLVGNSIGADKLAKLVDPACIVFRESKVSFIIKDCKNELEKMLREQGDVGIRIEEFSFLEQDHDIGVRM